VESDRRFSALERLYGVPAARRIRQAHVVVVGLGGVGSWAAEALARSGVGRLTLIDMDHVAESNINRQVQATDTTVGQAKVQAMRERIALIHPTCAVHGIEEFVETDNWPALLAGGPSPDAVIDACDQLRAKLVMAAWARGPGRAVDFISAGAAGGKRLAHQVDIADLAACTHDPLLAQLRNRLRKEHGAPREGRAIGVPCVFSREPVQPVDPSCAIESDGSLNCHGYGSIVSVTATFGQCAAGWILNQLALKARSPAEA
jgi:tRNA A37 threonylcarbamoyladenosine dehydratase